MSPNDLLNEYRSQIDKLDDQFLELLNKRAELALKAGAVKDVIYDPKREEQIVARLEEKATTTFPREFVSSVFGNIINACRSIQGSNAPLQPSIKVSSSGPEELQNSSPNWPKVSRSFKPDGSKIAVRNTIIGGDDFVVIAGPCSIESMDQIMTTAQFLKSNGASILRGGAFKSRTNPYSFQGLGWDGILLLGEASRAVDMPIVSEVMNAEQVRRMSREVDMFQIGARNMQNFDLLRSVGRTQTPVMLKRGLSASLDELLAAAEYIVTEGNPRVVLCERGIRTFETATRYTLDISAVPVLKERTHLPVIVDPSHAVGVRRWIKPLCMAIKASGADGIMIEVHPNPPKAKSDKDQALTFDDFSNITEELKRVPRPIY